MIEELQMHSSQEIYEKALEIIEKYLGVDGEDAEMTDEISNI